MYSREEREIELLKQHAKRHCSECGEMIMGRSDKKFCDDACRNNFNNRAKSGESLLIRGVNLILKRNRRILKQTLERGHSKARRSNLLQNGFSFEHFTGCREMGGSQYNFIYEYGFLPVDKDNVLIVKSNDPADMH